MMGLRRPCNDWPGILRPLDKGGLKVTVDSEGAWHVPDEMLSPDVFLLRQLFEGTLRQTLSGTPEEQGVQIRDVAREVAMAFQETIAECARNKLM